VHSKEKKKEIGLESALSRMRAQRRTKKDMNNKDRARKRTTWRIEGPKALSRKKYRARKHTIWEMNVSMHT